MMLRKVLLFIYGIVFVGMLHRSFRRIKDFYWNPFVMNNIYQRCLVILYQGERYVVLDTCVDELHKQEMHDLIKCLKHKHSLLWIFPDLNIVKVDFSCGRWIYHLSTNFYKICTIDTIPIKGIAGESIKGKIKTFLKHRRMGVYAK